MEDGEDGHVRADAERHREDGNGGKGGPPLQASRRNAKVVKDSIHGSRSFPRPRRPRSSDELAPCESQPEAREDESRDLVDKKETPVPRGAFDSLENRGHDLRSVAKSRVFGVDQEQESKDAIHCLRAVDAFRRPSSFWAPTSFFSRATPRRVARRRVSPTATPRPSAVRR